MTPHLAFLCQFFVGEGGEKSKGGAAVLRPGQSVLKGKRLKKRGRGLVKIFKVSGRKGFLLHLALII